MRSPARMDSIAIEITNHCVRDCSNCTRFCGHHVNSFFMSMEDFKQAVDSLVDFPGMVGFLGGEPLLHPDFEELCDYAISKISRDRLGLWSTLPEQFRHHRNVIVRTFGNLLLNDHARTDIMHAPVLVGIEEVAPNKTDMWLMVDDCWVQNHWSASITPRGAFFCEVAAAMSHLFDGSRGWPAVPGWWKRTPKDFGQQIEEYCRRCGCAMPLRRRPSSDGRDDISPGNLERLISVSRKIANGEYVVSDFECEPLPNGGYPDQVYKDEAFRDRIAAGYGIALIHKPGHYDEPFLVENMTARPKPLFEIMREKA